MALEAFRRLQISNPEDTIGSAEAAVELLKGRGTWEEVLTIHWPTDDRNSLALHQADDEVVGKEVRINWEGDLNARHAVWQAAMAIRGNVTPTQPDAENEPNSYLWTFEPAYTTANTPDQADGVDTFTVEYGDDTQAYETEYCFATRWTIEGRPNEAVQFRLEMVGRQRMDTTFTGSLSAQSVQILPFNKAKFYLDSSWANLGNTQKTGLLRAFSFEFDTGLRPFYTSDGDLYFARVTEVKKAPTLTLTYAWGSDADTERTAFENRTTRFARLTLYGSTEQDSGQGNPPYVEIDMALRYAGWPEWGADEGMTTFEVPANAVYDSTGGHMFQVKCYNLLDTYPT